MLGAVKLYEMGRLSSGCAVELAGVSLVEFLKLLRVCWMNLDLSECSTHRLLKLESLGWQ